MVGVLIDCFKILFYFLLFLTAGDYESRGGGRGVWGGLGAQDKRACERWKSRAHERFPKNKRTCVSLWGRGRGQVGRGWAIKLHGEKKKKRRRRKKTHSFFLAIPTSETLRKELSRKLSGRPPTPLEPDATSRGASMKRQNVRNQFAVPTTAKTPHRTTV